MTTPTATDTAPGQHTNQPGLLERPLSRAIQQAGPGSRLRGRPELYTAYKQDMGLLNTPGKRIGVLAILAVAVWFAFALPNDWVTLLATTTAACIGAIALNIVTGYAGQVSLGHAFFIGIGAYASAVISGDPDGSVLGFGISLFPIPLLVGGLVAGLAGLLVAPLALRLKGLYLAIVTLGLVLLGEHIFRTARTITGGAGLGRPGTQLTAPGYAPQTSGEVLGIFMTREAKLYLLGLGLLVVVAIATRNLARSDLGRAFSAVRDRDIAAEIIGVDLTRAKVLAFVISSFFAGVSGALLYAVLTFAEPGSFNLLMSIRFVAMILIGGVATVSGAIMGAVFISMLARFSREMAELLPQAVAISPELFEGILYGVLIVGFLIFEPRGLFGIWLRIRNYWKGWPFSY